MNIDKIERRLKKINSVLEIFKEDNKLTRIEKDLLLGYVRELYDLILLNDEENLQKEIEKIENTIPTASIIAEIKNPTIEEEIVIDTKQIDLLKEETLAPIVEVQETLLEPVKQLTDSELKVVEQSHSQKTKYPQELEEIFEIDKYADVSEKLGMSKITSIIDAIGLNDKLLMTKELFNGNGELFMTILNKIEKAEHYEIAKSIILDEVAIPMKWVETDKLEKAESLAQLIWRKFKLN
jgi:hypothetical protein